MDIIEVDNLTYYYPGGSKPALANISLKISRGDFLLITGPSGSGKSTLIKTFNGIIPHLYGGRFEGKVTVKGRDTRYHTVAELSRIVGIVFQDPENQILTLSVEREIAFGLENLGLPRKVIKERVENALKDLSIEHLRDRIPIELSVGEQQKVVVASAIAMMPEVLVFDEPTAHMDPLSALKFLNLVHELNEKGYTIVIVEHRLDMVAKYANKMIILKDGKIIAEGRPRDILPLEITEESGVDVPRYIRLYRKISNAVGIKKFPVSIEEAAVILKEVLGHGKSY